MTVLVLLCWLAPVMSSLPLTPLQPQDDPKQMRFVTTREPQDIIQRKLIKAFQLKYPTISSDDWPAVKRFYQAYELNGLCGGWATIHRFNPIFLEDMWFGLDQWLAPDLAQEQVGDKGPAVIVFRGKQTTVLTEWNTFNAAVKNGEDALFYALAAWEFMRVKYEPQANYEVIPEAICGELTRYNVESYINKRATPLCDKVNFDLSYAGKKKDIGMTIVKLIRSFAEKEQRGVTAHIECVTHHMSVRYKYEAIRKQQPKEEIVVVETEKVGIKNCKDPEEAAKIIQDYLDGDSETEADVIVYRIP